MFNFDLKAGPIKYGFDSQTYGAATNVPSDCNSITFINLGTNVATIDNSIPLQQNQTFSIEGNQGEIISQVFQIKFTGAGTNSLVVCRKFYI